MIKAQYMSPPQMSAMPNPHFLSPQNTCSNEPYLKSSKNIPRTFHQDYHNKFSSSGNPAAYRTGPMNISSNFPTREGFYQQFGPERNRIKGQRQSSPSHFNKFNRELSPKAAFLQQTIKKRATSPNERFKNIPNSPPQYINRNLPPNFQKEQDFFKFNRTVPESNLNINMSPNRYRKLEHQEQIPNRSFDLFNSRVVEHNPNNRQNFEYINPRVPEFRQNKGPLEFNPQMPEFIQRAKMPYDNRGGPPEFSELNPYGRDLPPYPQSFRNPMQGSTAPETEYRPHVKLPPPNGEFYRELPNSMSFAPGLDKNVGLNREPESFLEKYGVLNGGLQRRPESFLERSRSLQRGPESFIERNRVFNQGPEFSDRNPGFNRDPEFLKRNMDLLNRGPEFFDRNITLNRGPEPLERNPDFNRAQESFPGRPIRDDYLLKPSMKRPFEFRDDFVLQPPIINRQYNDFGPFSANLPDFSSDIHKPIELGNSFRAPFFKSDTSTFKSRTFDEYQSFKPQSFDEFLPSVPINFPQHNFNNYSPHKSEMKGSRFEEQKKIHLDKDFDEIVDALKEYIFFERSIQESKESVCRRPDFKLIRLIKEFDDNETGQIVFTEFKNGLNKFGVKADDSDISLLINRYSRDGDKKLDYKEFSNIILPFSEINKSNVLSKEDKIEKMSPETYKSIARLFKMLLNCHYSCELIRKDLAHKKTNLTKVFEFIASLAKGKTINKESLIKFFEKYYFYPSNEDIGNLMETFDRNKTGMINLKEFEYELNPKLK